jgi:hypothetical protein
MAGLAAFASGGLASVALVLENTQLSSAGMAVFFVLGGACGSCFGVIIVALCNSLAQRWASGWRMAIVAACAGCAAGMAGIVAFFMAFVTMPREFSGFLFE